MAKFTATVPLKIKLPSGVEIDGPAGATHRIPDALYEEFARDVEPSIPGGLTWITQDETSNIPTLPISQANVSGLAASLAGKYDKTGGTISGAVSVTGALDAASIISAAVTATTARIKGTPWHDVRAYGATGDGTTDDRTAIQSAITAAGSGGTIYFPPGTYKISAAVTATVDNLTITGAAPEASIIYNTGTAQALLVYDAARSINRFRAANISIKGTSAGTIGLEMQAVIRQVELDRVRFIENGTWGCQFTADAVRPINRVMIINCEFLSNYLADSSGGAGGGLNVGQQCEQLYLYAPSIRGNDSISNPQTNAYGIKIADYINVVTIYGGDIGSLGRGISINGGGSDSAATSTIVIRGIYFEMNRRDVHISAGVASAARNVMIEDNSFRQTQSECIYVHNGKGVFIRGNEVVSSAATFIQLDSNAVDVMVGHNPVAANYTGTFLQVLNGAPKYYYTEPRQLTARVSTGSISAGVTTDITVNFSNGFLDTNYTVIVTPEQGTVPNLFQVGVKSKSTTSCVVTVKNADVAARTATLHVHAIHDGGA